MHSKFATFDGKVAIVGSFNLDPTSFDRNSETVLVFQEEKLVSSLNSLYADDLMKSLRMDIGLVSKYLMPSSPLASMEITVSQWLERWM